MEDLACMAIDHRQFCHPVIAMYFRTSGDMNVNTAWMILLSQMSRNIDNIPPTQAALDQHIKRSSYQSGHMWGQSLEVQPELPDVTDWGWETSETAGYIPKRTTLRIVEVACLELISCKCAKSCKGELQLFQGRPGMHPTLQMWWDLL